MTPHVSTTLRLAWLLLVTGACVATAPSALLAQEEERAPARPDTAAAAVDTVAAPGPSGPSPMGAFFRSVVLPGWGQFYADQEVRGIVYSVVQAANLYMVVRTNNRVHDTDDEALREARRDQREDWLVWAGFWALASGVDAWVSAQMWSFEGEVVPPPDGSAGVALRMTVPVRGF